MVGAGDKIEAVMRDMNKSASYDNLLAPVISRLLNSECNILKTEGAPNEICKALDLNCGVDWLLEYSHCYIPIAKRIQYGKNWRTFTVRKTRDNGYESEYYKIKHAMKTGGIYPRGFVHGYIDEISGKVCGAGIVSTRDLIEFIDKGLAYMWHTGAAQKGQASFFVCAWDELKKQHYDVREYQR